MAKDEGKKTENSEIVAREAAPDDADGKPKMSIVASSAAAISEFHYFAQFKGRPMLMTHDPFPHYTALHDQEFARIAYPVLGGVTRGRIKDVQAFVGAMAPDLTRNSNLILFGTEDNYEEYYHQSARTVLWDADILEARTDTDFKHAVWRSPYGPISAPGVDGTEQRIPFVMSLAGNDVALYDDIMQSLAPMIMTKKPDGVIWWVGDGANGKSTLMEALYKIFPGQLASLTVATLTAKVDTPFLNGNLANIVKESSEGRIEDTDVYKAVGTHENFRTHRMYSQETTEVNGNMHHIFSANAIPSFNDKGYSARRRTFIIPFSQRFDSDPTFEDRTFTPEMFGRLIHEMMRYAKIIAARGYTYKWSPATMAAKGTYDTSANNAEEYARHLAHEGVLAFDSFAPVKMDYENWCSDEGYVPLGISNLTRAMTSIGYTRSNKRTETGPRRFYRLPEAEKATLIPFGMGKPGMYTVQGFRPTDIDDLEPLVPDFPDARTEEEPPEPPPTPTPEPDKPPEAPPETKSILNNRW